MKSRHHLPPPPKRLRARAERLLAASMQEVAEMPATDAQKLLHELQVHQIELEMQNDELRRTQSELEKSLDRYAELFDFSPAALLTLTAQGEILESNLNAGKMLGLERDQLIHQKFTRFISADSQDAFYLFCRQVFGSGARQELELNLISARGKSLVVQVEAARDAVFARKQCRLSLTDVTERKRAEDMLQAREAQLHYFVQHAPVGIAMFDRDMNYLAFSKRWLSNYQFEGQDLTGQNHYRVFSDLPEHWKQLHRKCLAGEFLNNDEDLWVRKNGNRIWVRWSMTPWRDSNGQIGGIMLVVEDITQRKDAEESLRLFQTLANQSGDTFEVIDPKTGRILDVNDHGPAELGYTRAEYLAMRVSDIDPTVTRTGWTRLAKKIQAAGSLKSEGLHQRKDGTVFPVEFNAKWVQLDREYIVTSVRDITERKQTEERLAQLNRVRAVLAGVDREIVRIKDRQKLLKAVCQVAVNEGGFKLAWIGMTLPNGDIEPVAKAGLTEYVKHLRVVTQDVPEGRGPVGTAIRENRHVVIEDIYREPKMSPWLKRARQFGLRYAAAFPIQIAGYPVGAFSVYATKVDFFDENELALLSQVSYEISFALTALADIEARQEAEQALSRSERNLSIFFNQAPIGLLWLSASGTVLRVNQAQLDLIGDLPEQSLGRNFYDFCLEPEGGKELLKRLAAREIIRNKRMVLRGRSGALHHVLVDATPIFSASQLLYSSIFLRDITDRVQLEQEILQVSEREHRRISQDLHDGLGQLLVGAAYLASGLRQDLAAKSLPEARPSGRIVEVISEAIAQTRNLARGLHPVEPEPNGLMAALEALAGRTQTLFKIRCRFICPRPVLIQDAMVATHLFRIAQEAITNAIKHGKSSRIQIRLAETPARINLAIQNNGRSMPARPPKKSGMGLRIMRYRAGMIGGSFAIQKSAGGETVVLCSVHLPDLANMKQSSPGPQKPGLQKIKD